jgi:DNA-binding MarR family transcriptional regulator
MFNIPHMPGSSTLPSVPSGLPSDQVHETASILNSVAIRLLRRIRESDRTATGLTAARASLLSVLVYGGPLPIGRLADIEQVTPPAITKLVDGLEKEGLVSRRRSAADRRVVEVVATAAGRTALERGRAARVVALAGLLEDLSDHDLVAVRRAAEHLARLIA